MAQKLAKKSNEQQNKYHGHPRKEKRFVTSARGVAVAVVLLFLPPIPIFCWKFCSAFSVGDVRFIDFGCKKHERPALVEHGV